MDDVVGAGVVIVKEFRVIALGIISFRATKFQEANR